MKMSARVRPGQITVHTSKASPKMTDDIQLRTQLLLSLQRALLGAVTPSLREVTCGWHGATLLLRFTFDGAPEEGQVEAAHIVGSEVISDFSDSWNIEEQIVRHDYPAPLTADPDRLPLTAYRRWEVFERDIKNS